MVAGGSGAVRTTLYRLTGVTKLRHAIEDKYLAADGDFQSHEVQVLDHEALLVYGSMSPSKVKWAGYVEQLTGVGISPPQATASGVLLIDSTAIGDVNPDEERAIWALSYGMGFHLLKTHYYDSGFGQKFALRTVDPDELQSLTRVIFGRGAMTQRSSIPGGESVRRFGVGDIGEIITRIVARAELNDFAVGTGSFGIRGSDSLSIPLGKAPADLIQDLKRIDGMLSDPVKPGLEVFEQLVPIKGPPELLSQLEGALAAAFESSDDFALGISWPSERVDEFGSPNAHKISGVGRYGVGDGAPSVETIVDIVRRWRGEERLGRLREAKIQLFSDPGAAAGSAISSQIPVIKWIAFEHRIGSELYCLHGGQWFRLHQEHVERIDAETARIFRNPIPEALRRIPAYQPGEHEDSYNVRLAKSVGGTALDAQMVKTSLHPRGIEACDVYGPGNEFLHSKRVKRSQDVSHLLAQMVVSADSIRNDSEGRSALWKKLTSAGRRIEESDVDVAIAGLVIASPKQITAEKLFTFSKVSLVQNVRVLETQGVDVFVNWTERLD